MRGILYSVALPIGHALDITERARQILSQVEVIASEDTRKTRDWLRRCGINTEARLLAYHGMNEVQSAKGILISLKEGKSVALVSDAGTPRLSDPGYQLMRAAWEENIRVVPIPGPAALTALISVSPLPVEPLLFLGFTSPKPGRRLNQLARYNDFEGTVVFYESVHRIEKLLEALKESWGDIPVLIGRELTKEHEELFWGDLGEAIDWVQGKKGEFVLLVRKKTLNSGSDMPTNIDRE